MRIGVCTMYVQHTHCFDQSPAPKTPKPHINLITQGLASITQEPCPLKVQLTLTKGGLQYDPPLEELRTQYYRSHLRAFLNIPALFKVCVCVWGAGGECGNGVVCI